MFYRQFMWSQSNSVLILALAGGFWFGIVGSTINRPGIMGPLGIVGLVSLLWGFISLRRKSAGFSLAELKNGTEQQRNSLRLSQRGLRRALLIEAVLCSVAVGGIEYLHRPDLLWPALGLAVSLHFVPIGRLFQDTRYYVSAISGTVICLVAVVAFKTPATGMFAAAGMCLNMWGTAAWLLASSEQMAARETKARL